MGKGSDAWHDSNIQQSVWGPMPINFACVGPLYTPLVVKLIFHFEFNFEFKFKDSLTGKPTIPFTSKIFKDGGLPANRCSLQPLLRIHNCWSPWALADGCDVGRLEHPTTKVDGSGAPYGLNPHGMRVTNGGRASGKIMENHGKSGAN